MGAIWTIVVVVAIAVSSFRRFTRTQKNANLERAAQNLTARNRAAAQTPFAPAAAAAPRRRVAAQPVMPPVVPATARAAAPPAELDDPFAGLGLIGEEPAAGTARRRMNLGGGVPLGSKAWAANAVVAAEILSPPLGLRGGATLGPQDAF